MNMRGDDELYLNREGKAFKLATTDYFPATPWGAMSAGVFDHNLDGQFDLLVTDMHSDMSEDIGPSLEKNKSRMQWPTSFLKTEGGGIFGNAFYQQVSQGEFVEQSDAVGTENYWPWGVSIGDVNADGYPDAFIASSMCFPYRYGINSLLLNNIGEGFVDAQFSLGIEPRKAEEMIAPWFSLDASGTDAEHPICRNREGRLVVWSATGSRSSVMLDYDNDGDLDIITNEFNTPPQVFESDLSQQTKITWLKVVLVGTSSNRNGLGATVRVEANDKTYIQTHDGKSGYLSQSQLPLYFGLDGARHVDSLEIVWPSGTRQEIEGPLEVNRLHTITQQD